MRTVVVQVFVCLGLAACGENAGRRAAEFSADEVAAMSRTTQDRFCAVFSQLAIENGSDLRHSNTQDTLIALDSKAITGGSSLLLGSAAIPSDTQIPTQGDMRLGWVLSAPCVVIRPIAAAARTRDREQHNYCGGSALAEESSLSPNE